MYSFPLLSTNPLHTRYSELRQCANPTAALKVAMKRLEWLQQADTPDMRFGRIRHKMFERETKTTGKLPRIIKKNIWGFEGKVHPEVVLSAKIWGVGKLWGTIDNLIYPPNGAIIDYKVTKSDDPKAFDSRQLFTYAVLCHAVGIPVEQGWFVMEIWNEDKTKIIQHKSVPYTFEAKDLLDTKRWLRKRAKLLRQAIETVRPAITLLTLPTSGHLRPSL